LLLTAPVPPLTHPSPKYHCFFLHFRVSRFPFLSPGLGFPPSGFELLLSASISPLRFSGAALPLFFLLSQTFPFSCWTSASHSGDSVCRLSLVISWSLTSPFPSPFLRVLQSPFSPPHFPPLNVGVNSFFCPAPIRSPLVGFVFISTQRLGSGSDCCCSHLPVPRRMPLHFLFLDASWFNIIFPTLLARFAWGPLRSLIPESRFLHISTTWTFSPRKFSPTFCSFSDLAQRGQMLVHGSWLISPLFILRLYYRQLFPSLKEFSSFPPFLNPFVVV